MKNKNRPKLTLRQKYEYYKYDCFMSGESTTFVSFLLVMLRYWIEAQICKYKGHKWIDDGSYAGPESGAENLVCKRCGEEFHHIYY